MSHQDEQQEALVRIIQGVGNGADGLLWCVPYIGGSEDEHAELWARLSALRNALRTAWLEASVCAKLAAHSDARGIPWRCNPPKQPEVK